MVEVEVKNRERVIETVKSFRNDLKGENYKTMEKVCAFLMNHIQANKLSGQALKRRTGRLAGGMNYKVLDELGNIVGRVGDKVVYAPIHEFGKTIEAKRAKYLTIPLSPALTSAGVLRKPARQWENTFVKKSKNNNLIIFQKQSKGIVPLFLLKKSVKIPARPYFKTGLEETKSNIFAMIGHSVDTAIIKTNNKV